MGFGDKKCLGEGGALREPHWSCDMVKSGLIVLSKFRLKLHLAHNSDRYCFSVLQFSHLLSRDQNIYLLGSAGD